MVLASCHHFGAQNFQVALGYMENLCARRLMQFMQIRSKRIIMPFKNTTQAI
jgi:hypothetical protein